MTARRRRPARFDHEEEKQGAAGEVREAKSTLDRHLRALVRAKGWTVREFAAHAGISPSYAHSFLYTSLRRPGPEMTQRLAAAFDLPVEDMLKLAGYLPATEAEKSAISGYGQGRMVLQVPVGVVGRDQLVREAGVLASEPGIEPALEILALRGVPSEALGRIREILADNAGTKAGH